MCDSRLCAGIEGGLCVVRYLYKELTSQRCMGLLRLPHHGDISLSCKILDKDLLLYIAQLS